MTLRRRWLVWVWVGAVILALAVVGSGGQGGVLDPNGTGAQGAKAFVLLLRQYGAVVTLDQGTPGAGVDAAVVLSDRLDAARRRAVAEWARRGGELVVADPGSPLQVGAPTAVGNGLTTRDLQPTGPCDVPGLGGVQQLSVGSSYLLRVPPGQQATTCFSYGLGDGEQASFLVRSGSVVGLGGAGLWTNQRLAQDDNAALAVGLLAPVDGRHVDVLVASPAGSGSSSLLDILDPRLKWALGMLVVAFGALVWWRGRRFGRPITEAGPVQLAGSEIVGAVGDLMARAGTRDAAAHQLRAAARARLGAELGLGPGAPADAVAARAGVPRALLEDSPVPDDAALVRLARSLADAHPGGEPARPPEPARGR
jgi:hypothetical protein